MRDEIYLFLSFILESAQAAQAHVAREGCNVIYIQ